MKEIYTIIEQKPGSFILQDEGLTVAIFETREAAAAEMLRLQGEDQINERIEDAMNVLARNLAKEFSITRDEAFKKIKSHL